jgi:5-methylcytosine-specific restriction endonuclease McrA
MKINSTKIKVLTCVTCGGEMPIKVFANILHPEYDQPIVVHRKKLACSTVCLNEWQRVTKWEDRIGKETASVIRAKRKEQIVEFNPSTDPKIAKKISAGVKRYINSNPGIREGVNNPFHGHTHSSDRKEYWAKNKSGKYSCNSEQAEKQRANTPREEAHPNWLGGTSYEGYGPEFTRELKAVIKESYDYTCQACNVKTTILDVHHIDYDKQNNASDNLVPLCKTCHGKSNFNREEWKNFFQKLLK